MPNHEAKDKDKKPPKPSDMFKKASKHNMLSSEFNDAAAKHFDGGATDQAQQFALKAHAHQLEATKHLNEAIKHLIDVKGEGGQVKNEADRVSEDKAGMPGSEAAKSAVAPKG